MWTWIRKTIVRSLAAAGYVLLPRRVADEVARNAFVIDRHAATLREMEGLYRATYFSDLPERPGRQALLAELLGTNPSEAFFIIGHLHRCLRLDGDLCEFGVAQGTTSALIANEIKDSSKTLWLFDSFEGLPPPTAEDVLIHDIEQLGAIERYAGRMACPETMVRQRLAAIGFPAARTKIVRGFLEATLDAAEVPAAVGFAYVDLDFYAPTRRVLRFLHGVTPPGATLVVDDYGFFSTGVKQAVDEFVEAQAGAWVSEPPPPFAGHFAVLRKR